MASLPVARPTTTTETDMMDADVLDINTNDGADGADIAPEESPSKRPRQVRQQPFHESQMAAAPSTQHAGMQ